MTYIEFIAKSILEGDMTLEQGERLLRKANRLKKAKFERALNYAMSKVFEENAARRKEEIEMQKKSMAIQAKAFDLRQEIVDAQGVYPQDFFEIDHEEVLTWTDEELVPGENTVRGWIYKIRK